MLKPLIIVAAKEIVPSYRPEHVAEQFTKYGFNPVFCEYDVAQITKGKVNVDNFLVALSEPFDDNMRLALYYLRDICIDEEKCVFLCGNKNCLKEAKKILPAMIVTASYEIGRGELEYVAGRMKEDFAEDGTKPGCLIIDDDLEYNQKFRLALREYCDVAFSDGRPAQTTPYIGQTNLLIMSVDMKLDIVEWTRIRGAIKKNAGRKDFYVVFLAKNAMRQTEVTRYIGGKTGVCLSKEMDFMKNANYLRKRYFSA